MRNDIKRLWKEKRLRQEDLAQRCSVSCQTIQAVENDKRDPTLLLARELGMAASCSIWIVRKIAAAMRRATGWLPKNKGFGPNPLTTFAGGQPVAALP